MSGVKLHSNSTANGVNRVPRIVAAVWWGSLNLRTPISQFRDTSETANARSFWVDRRSTIEKPGWLIWHIWWSESGEAPRLVESQPVFDLLRSASTVSIMNSLFTSRGAASRASPESPHE